MPKNFENEPRHLSPGTPPALQADVAAAISGDRAGLARVLMAVAPDITRVARTLVGRQPTHPAGLAGVELEDVVQEALMGLVRALPSFRGECSVRTLSHRITVRCALHARRRARTGRRNREALEASWEDAGGTAPKPGVPPDEIYLAARRQQLLQDLLDRLPDVQAETLALRVVLGLSLEETAAATGVPVGTVRSRMRVAREALRTSIERDPQGTELLGRPR